MGTYMVRLAIGGIGLAMLVGGVLVGYVIPGIFPAIWMIASGVVLLIVAVVETMRYHSGPGGGEPGPPDPRFRPTEEVFVDPTSQLRMRVYADSRTGERRYVAEG